MGISQVKNYYLFLPIYLVLSACGAAQVSEPEQELAKRQKNIRNPSGCLFVVQHKYRGEKQLI